jgi:hypothetical protein
MGLFDFFRSMNQPKAQVPMQAEQPAPTMTGGGNPLGGIFGGLSGFNEKHPGFLMGAGQLLKGEDLNPAILYAMGVKKERKAEAEKTANQNKTKAWLLSQGMSEEEIDAYIGAGQVGQLFKRTPGGADDVTYGKSPIWGKDADGNDVLGTIGDDGTFRQIDTGEFTPSRGLEKVDLGTAWGFRDKGTGQIVHTEPKDIRGVEREQEIGTSEGKAASSAPADYQAGQNALDVVDQIMTHPAMDSGTGFSSKIWNGIPGTDTYDFQNLVDQAKSGAFLTAIQQMRGLGALSNSEGSAATQAITRMNTATSREAFIAALNDYRAIVEQGMANAQRRGSKAGVDMPPGSAPAGGGRLRYNPDTGELE